MFTSVCLSCRIFVIFWIQCSFGFKIGSFNLDQVALAYKSSEIEPFQLEEIAASDIDVLCVQELVDPVQALKYQETLHPSYPYAFSGADLFDFDNFPRAPCSSDQIDLFTADCIMDNCFYEEWPETELFIACLAESCWDIMSELLYTECSVCMAFCEWIEGCSTETIDSATSFCSSPLEFPTAFIDGTMILSKYPIVNSWHYHLPSFFEGERGFTLAEIDVCDVTESDDDGECEDTIVVGCLHLQHIDDTFFPVTQEQIDLGISSHAELNAYQSQYILDNVLSEENRPWSDDDDVIGVFIAGDWNVGINETPENMDIWTDAGYGFAKDLDEIPDENNIKDGCTWCADPDGDFPNALAERWCTEVGECSVLDMDLDHILVYNDKKDGDKGKGDGGCDGLSANSYLRGFTDIFDINGEDLPLSDHWGVVLDFDFITKTSDGKGKENKK